VVGSFSISSAQARETGKEPITGTEDKRLKKILRRNDDGKAN
jgi:hypothetical protein